MLESSCLGHLVRRVFLQGEGGAGQGLSSRLVFSCGMWFLGKLLLQMTSVHLEKSCKVLGGQDPAGPELISEPRVSGGYLAAWPLGLSGKVGSFHFPVTEAGNGLPRSLSDSCLFSKQGWLTRGFTGLRGTARNRGAPLPFQGDQSMGSFCLLGWPQLSRKRPP